MSGKVHQKTRDAAAWLLARRSPTRSEFVTAHPSFRMNGSLLAMLQELGILRRSPTVGELEAENTALRKRLAEIDAQPE